LSLFVKIYNKDYKVNIIKKSNKHIYIRVNDDLEINVSGPKSLTKNEVLKLIDINVDSVHSMIKKTESKKNKDSKIFIFGKEYDLIVVPQEKKVSIYGDTILTPSLKKYEIWIKKEARVLFEKRVKEIFDRFEEEIPFPKIKIRSMKSRWGVCNRANNSITLNLLLMRKELVYLDYVIVHELSHFVHFNHSKSFWEVVSKYCKNYKKIRKELKE